MKLVLVSMLRNEADVVELFVRYHAEIVDAIHVVDHLSIDDTPQILRALIDEGLPLSVRRVDEGAWDQATQTSLLMREAGRGGADWVLPVDGDEFLVSTAGPSVRAAIEALPDGAPQAVRWRGYVPTEHDDMDEPHLLRRVTHRRDDAFEQHSKLLVPGAIARSRRSRLTVGNHRVERHALGKARTIRADATESLRLAHFPMRSPEQLMLKALTAWPALLANDRYHPEKFRSARLAFRDVLEGKPATLRTVSQAAAHYALDADRSTHDWTEMRLIEDPVAEPRPIELRWPGPRLASPMALMAETSERLAEELGRYRRGESTRRPFGGRARRSRSKR